MKLPKKPSALIRLALDDLRKVERSKKYKVNMNVYHIPFDSICNVCLAGAVMAKTLKIPPYSVSSTFNFNEGDKLRAINWLRCGSVDVAFHILNLPMFKGNEFNRNISNYSKRNKNKFHKQMRQLARDLEKGGY